jgi:hypothetical protein
MRLAQSGGGRPNMALAPKVFAVCAQQRFYQSAPWMEKSEE